MTTWITLLAVIALVVLVKFYFGRRRSEDIERILAKRRATSGLVTRAELVDGNRHLDVALSITDSKLFYENTDVTADLDLNGVDEIEYDNELSTGTSPHAGRVLRLRSHGQTLEFVIPAVVADPMMQALPARSYASPAVAQEAR